MFNLSIKSSVRDYQVSFINDFKETILKKINEGDVLIIDQNINQIYQAQLNTVKANKIIIEATEYNKSYLQLAPIIEQLIKEGFKKNHKLFALGGGIIQDITAFISSILYRGVQWDFFPTTLLAQCDSCIGGKTSVNFGQYKNQIGNFYPPSNIYIDTQFLSTLEEKEISSGLGEMSHYFLVSGEEDFQIFKKNYPKARKDPNTLRELIKKSLEIKKRYIEIDEFDKNERQVFNYGHSFGHAIESLTNYEIPHGIAVSIGIDIANYVSVEYGLLENQKRTEIRDLLSQIWQGFNLKKIDQNKFEDALRKDKKNKGHLLGLILSKSPGQTFKDFYKLDSIFSKTLEKYLKNEI